MPPSQKTVQLLVNPHAGSRRVNRAIGAAGRHFTAPRWRLLVNVLAGPEEAYILAKSAARQHRWAVIVAGGDGTVNEAARALIGTRTRLGVIPAGTGNGFARALKTPMDLDKACSALALGRTFACDAGVIDRHRIFVNVCGVGMDAWIAHKANQLRWITRLSGFLRYLGAGLLSLAGFRPPILSLRLDGRQAFEGRLLVAAVANSEQYGFGTVIAPGAEMGDGAFDVVLIPPLPLHKFLYGVARMLSGRPIPWAMRFKAGRVDIRCVDGRAPLHLDGEPAGQTPVSIVLKPRAIQVLLPRP